MLRAVSLSKHYDAELLFEGVDFTLNAGDRLGLVGPNGAGKTTLLRLLTGAEKPTSGHVSLAPRRRIGYFAQQVPDPDISVLSFLSDGEADRLARRMRTLEARMADDAAALEEYGQVQERWLALEGWSAPQRRAEVRERLDIAHLPDDLPVGEVSGGEQARLMLARVLLATPDVLILDEPTNHLDAAGTAWLGGFLAGFRGAVLVVTHDRAFLDRTVTRIVELDGIHTTPQWYEGGYTDYRAEKTRRWQKLLLDHEAQEKFRRRLEADIASTKDQARGVEESVRSGLGSDKIRRYAKKVAKKAKARERRLTRQLTSARWIAEPSTRPPLTLAFPAPRATPEPAATGATPGTAAAVATPGTAATVSARGLTVKLGSRRVLDDVSLDIHGRVLVTGPNGAGKTTLLRVLSGRLQADAGAVTTTADVAVLPQTHDDLRRDDRTVLGFFRSRVPVYVDEAESLLEAHLFGPDEWGRRLRDLSAGELRRLLLAVIVNTGAQVLFLDEPTNYLDFEAIDVVEEALRAYQGTLVMITHDEYFARNVGYDHRWHVTDGHVRAA
ncbi:ABC-F family ATP-binding cassette domain-containing protein [Dactylosporangium sp. NPDC000521]|uniref:ABC-F family ATP-binding cassette domain-containing protein n=1 Tax=Dactylosporangium sp. NPDC000521 TaxID=3363975 RepID=UPI0036D198EB